MLSKEADPVMPDKIQNDRWRYVERGAYISTIIGLPLVFLALILGYFQLKEGNRAARLTNYITLTDQFFNRKNTQIISAIENAKPILSENKGAFTDEDLDNYLGDFETIYTAFQEGLLSEKQLCVSFSYYLERTEGNVEIKDYIASSRKAQRKSASPYFVGFSRLVQVARSSKLPDCH